MKATSAKTGFSLLPKDYARLCQILTPRPFHDHSEFENVTEITDLMAGHKLTPDQEDYFDLLCRLIEVYETTVNKAKNVKACAKKGKPVSTRWWKLRKKTEL
jgi:hypothetical protein